MIRFYKYSCENENNVWNCNSDVQTTESEFVV